MYSLNGLGSDSGHQRSVPLMQQPVGKSPKRKKRSSPARGSYKSVDTIEEPYSRVSPPRYHKKTEPERVQVAVRNSRATDTDPHEVAVARRKYSPRRQHEAKKTFARTKSIDPTEIR